MNSQTPSIPYSLPAVTDVPLARESPSAVLTGFGDGSPTARLRLVDDRDPGRMVELPPAALRLIDDMLGRMSRGEEVALVTLRPELTTQEAADMLHVSRPYLIGLLERGEIPHRLVGTHRRVRRADVAKYKADIDARRARVLDALVADAQELGMGY